ncbi:ATP-dependent helicase [Ahrensia sp. R2A130]|uniref:ATP-dependent helicase n=1 Tax=Ahrensia sp. R2A130 TaxID=744979 RepID=UPI0001E0C31D|nr:UvrD-helicase domain-containing protein [Ahrensia sp. R2A130]EFL90789.1 ATP-dependent helicase PcrA [Ahrensia sp. R2A130]
MNEPVPNRPQSGGSITARALGASRPASADGAQSYLDGLNPEQRDAVLTTEGPLLVLAGAGTGKTRVLTTRITHILQQRMAWPSQILAVTFTNKAAREMKHRIAAQVGEAVEGMPWLGTFHSICVKILRRHAELVQLKSGFTILDTDDQVRLMKQLIQAENIDDKRWPAKQLAGLIDGWKNKALTPSQVPEGDARAFANGRGRELYRAYQDRLKILNACDFGDLLVECIRLFKENPDVLLEYRERFKYILVDEYQDTNVAQYLWLRLLAGKGDSASKSASDNPAVLSSPDNIEPTKQIADDTTEPNICCVGDDDQSIYGWRGAEVDNILRFDKDFPGSKVIKLERNYRSTTHILKAASHLIAHNEGRLGKTLFTDDTDTDAPKVKVAAGWDSEEEARAIGEEIEAVQRKGHALNDIAILMRASFQMREFEDRFVSLGLNYRVIGGPRFYERLEIRDAMAYFRVVCQPADDLAFERIVNTPKRGLGDTTIKKIRDHARVRRIPMLVAVQEMVETSELGAKQRGTLKTLALNFERWAQLIDSTSHTDLAEIILDESGYTEFWQNDRSAEAPGRLDNLKELVRSMHEFENLRGFLEHVSLVMDTENNPNLDAVTLMTLHGAKGLEFDTVFLPGWEEGLFPHQRSLDEGGRSGLEEERRLAYVGITRAKKNCHIWFVSNRRIHGQWQSSIPSRFIDELPADNVEVVEPSGSYGGYGAGGLGSGRQWGAANGGYGESRFDKAANSEKAGSNGFGNSNFGRSGFDGSSYSSPGWKRAQANATDDAKTAWGTRSGHKTTYNGGPRTIEGELVAKSVIGAEDSKFGLGERVFHMKFGYGAITNIDGNKLTIDFEKAGEKRVLDSFVEGT